MTMACCEVFDMRLVACLWRIDVLTFFEKLIINKVLCFEGFNSEGHTKRDSTLNNSFSSFSTVKKWAIEFQHGGTSI